MPRFQLNHKATPWFAIPKLHAPCRTATIIGGGLAGISTAYMLVRSGWQVTLIERTKQVASQASGNPSGIIMPLISHKDDSLGQFYRKGYEATLALLYKLNISIWNQCGVIDINPKHAGKKIVDICIPEHLVEETHFLGRPGFYFKEGGFIDVAKLCHHLLNDIIIIVEQEALQIVEHNRQWHVIARDKSSITSDIVIIANSYDALQFTQTSWLPIEKVRGQVTFLPKQDVALPHVICLEGYITPASQGYHTIGATYSRENITTIQEEDHLENLSPFVKLFGWSADILHTKHLKGRVAFRSSTPDRRAIIGPVPVYQHFKNDYSGLVQGRRYAESEVSTSYYPGLYINTAHGSRGLTSCIISAYYLTTIINNEVPLTQEDQKLLQLLLVSRFIIRELKKETKK